MRSALIKWMTALLLLFNLISPMTAYAAETPVGRNSGWVRAKLTYEFDDGVTGLSDDIVKFADGWTKRGDWYYYKEPVAPGDKIRFITCVTVPSDWTEKLENKKFAIIATAEVSEVAPGETGWNTNATISYSKSFDVWSMGYKHDEDVWVEEGNLSVHVHESQLDKNGNEVPYVNDKLIVPGEHISKIIDLEIGGALGENRKLKPKAPVKTVECKGQNVDGGKVDMGAVLNYSIYVENPAPDGRTITVTDTIDSRLKVLDTGGGTFTQKPASDGSGGILEWKVQVKGGEGATVSFTAQVMENVKDDVIPNQADATIVGQCKKSNTVFTNVGSPSVIKQVISRATYDTAHFAGAVILLGVLITGAIALVILIRKKKKEEV